MSLYSLLRPGLFCLDAETAHDVTLNSLRFCPAAVLPATVADPFDCFGLTFANRVGLAAGLDKNGDYIDALAKLGFGFIEIGTVTPLPQVGNPRPRLFRIADQQSILNRMGFNNKGVDYCVRQLAASSYRGILGVNIGKNKDTPLGSALDDYAACLAKVYPYASYIVVNISSPNTPGLRQLQSQQFLRALLEPLKAQQQELAASYQKHVPLLVKLAPDESEASLQAMADVLVDCQIEGVIATNTTIDHSGIHNSQLAAEAGGVSGALLTSKADAALSVLAKHLAGRIPIIAVGGIMSAADAERKITLGASMVQVYSGLIYRGPRLVADINRALVQSHSA